jgi:hypothetical protein
MEEILRFLISMVASIMVVETIVYFMAKWFMYYVSSPTDSSDHK